MDLRRLIITAAALLLVSTLSTYTSLSSASPVHTGGQGCVNQGSDRRWAAKPVCAAQRHLSWKSNHEPYFVSIGNPRHINAGVAWPPYLVINRRRGDGRWRMFRIGFRYDRNWRGYIFPTTAWKVISGPLRY